MTNRVITEKDRANARRLNNFWKAKKNQLNLDQGKAAKLLGYTAQATISQQLNAKFALNTDAILKWAQLLQVSPSDIDPDLGALGLSDTTLRRVKVPIAARMSGTQPGPFETVEIVTRMTRDLYGVTVDTDGFEPFAKKGSTLIVSKDEEPVSGDEVFIQYETASQRVHIVKRFVATDEDRGVIIVKGLTSEEMEELSKDRVALIDPIVSVERPIVNRPIRLRPTANAG